MIINDLDVKNIAFVPDETDSPLIVDPYAVLPHTVTFQGFKSIAGGILKSIVERELFSIRSLRKASLWISWGNLRVLSRLKRRSASLSLKLLIMAYSITDSVIKQEG